MNRTHDLRFTKPAAFSGLSTGSAEMGTLGERAVEALKRMGAGTCTSGEVAAIAAEVIANPPEIIRAAKRYLAAVGTEHEGAAAVALLGMLAGGASDATQTTSLSG